MPGVAVNPPPSGGSGFGSSSNSKWTPTTHYDHGFHKSQSSVTAAAGASSSGRYDGLSVTDLKQKAKESVLKEVRGVSAITMIKTARLQIVSAREHEAKGDLRMALGNYIKAALLTKLAMDSQEYLQESKSKGGGVIRRELNDLLEVGLLIVWVPQAHAAHRPKDETSVPELPL